jgi:hypoxanthine phosphoribosyltransferase
MALRWPDSEYERSMEKKRPGKLERVLLDEATLQTRVQELGREVSEHFRNRVSEEAPLVLVAILKGSFIFAADLARAIDIPVRVEFLGVRSYGDATSSSGVVQVTQDLSQSVEAQHVLLVEDIVDTGLTSSFLLDQMATRKAASVSLCSLLHKPARTVVAVAIQFLGFTIDDLFVVGYGLDVAQRFRNLPALHVFGE